LDEQAPLPQVTVNGEIVSADALDDSLCVEVGAEAREEARVSLRSAEAVATGRPRSGNFLYRMNVRARRYLCEFRDNYVAPAAGWFFSAPRS